MTVDNSGAGGGNGGTAYTSYRMIFTGVKDAALANSMQIAEIQFFGLFDQSYLEADFNEDGSVDGDDFLIWQGGFNQFPDGDATKMQGDANIDGYVDGDDS